MPIGVPPGPAPPPPNAHTQQNSKLTHKPVQKQPGLVCCVGAVGERTAPAGDDEHAVPLAETLGERWLRRLELSADALSSFLLNRFRGPTSGDTSQLSQLATSSQLPTACRP